MTLEEYLDSACKNKQIPGLVVAANARGLKYAKAFGACSLNENAYNKPLRTDSILWIASCTKLQTTIAALQCVEKRLLTLDSDVTKILPEFNNAEVLASFDVHTGAPIFMKSTKTLTLRHLLTHTSGLGYDQFSPTLQKYNAYIRKRPANLKYGKVADMYHLPLLFQPGTSWEYGVGIDWAGVMVERVTGLKLEEYMQTHIWLPLGMKDTTYRIHDRPELYERCMEMSERQGLIHPSFGTTMSPDGKVVPADKQPKDDKLADDFGGSGIYSSVVDAAKVLDSICLNDGKLLHESTVDSMFLPQLGDSSRARLARICSIKEMQNLFGLPSSVNTSTLDFGLGGMLRTEGGEKGDRKRVSMIWSGMPNIYWTINRTSGISLIFGTQLLPSGDPTFVGMYMRFEEEFYEKMRLDSDRRAGGGKGGFML